MQGLDSNPRSLFPRTRTARHQFAFGGVAFEVLADEGVQWELPDTYQRLVVNATETTTIADVACCVRVDRGLREDQRGDGLSLQQLSLQEAGLQTRFTASQLLGQLSEIRPGRYAATVRVAPGRSAASAVLLGVTSAVLQRLGGLQLHAAAIELDGEAVLFLGAASGGDATAAALAVGTGLFASERVWIAPGPDNRIWAFSVPEAAAHTRHRSARHALPVAAMLCVHEAHPAAKPGLRLLTGLPRMLAVREAVDTTDATNDDDDAKEHRFVRASRMSARIPVHELNAMLGESLGGLLREGLHSAQSARDEPKAT